MENSLLFSIWLVPQVSDKKKLGEIILDLGNKYQAPVFVPHMTAYACEIPRSEVESAIRFVRQIGTGTRPSQLNVKDVKHSPEFFKALYLDLETHPTLKHIYRRLTKAFINYSDYQLKPHLGLLYKEDSEIKLLDMTHVLDLPKTITFAEIGYVTHEKGEIKHRQVEKWRYRRLCLLKQRKTYDS